MLTEEDYNIQHKKNYLAALTFYFSKFCCYMSSFERFLLWIIMYNIGTTKKLVSFGGGGYKKPRFNKPKDLKG